MKEILEEDMSILILRQAEEKDLPPVKNLLAEADLPLAGIDETFNSFLVAETDGQVVGAVGLEWYPPYALLRSVVVSPEWQKQNIGRFLVAHALAKAKSRGAAALYLLTTTAPTYFPRFGFMPVAREKAPVPICSSVEFQSACPKTATLMYRPL